MTFPIVLQKLAANHLFVVYKFYIWYAASKPQDTVNSKTVQIMQTSTIFLLLPLLFALPPYPLVVALNMLCILYFLSSPPNEREDFTFPSPPPHSNPFT